MTHKSNRIMAALACALLFCSMAAAEEWATFAGQFVFGGEAPEPAPIAVTKDPEVCANKDLVDEQLVVNPESKGIANIVIYMYRKSSDPPPPIHESYAETADAKVSFANENCRFEPRVAAMRTTQTLVLENKDSVGHNMKIDCLVNDPQNPIMPGDSESAVKMPEVERLPVSVSCNIHPWMKGYLLVKDDPYFAVTDADGKFVIKNVPPGEWVFQFWHEKSGYVDKVEVEGEATKWKKGRLKVAIGKDVKDLGTITVPSETFEE